MSTTGINLSTPAVTTQNLTEAKSAQALRILKGQSQNGNPAKIDKAARDFESILLGEWLQQAEKSFATVPGAPESSDPGHDQFQSIGCEFLGGALSKAGGIGIASMISKRLKATEAARGASAEVKNEGNESNQVTPEGLGLDVRKLKSNR